MPQGRGGVDGGKHLAARRLDVAFEPLDVAQRDLVLLVVLGQPLGGLLPLLLRPRGGLPAVAISARCGSRRASRLASSSSRSAMRPPSVATCWRLSSTCCCVRWISSSCVCARSRAAVAVESASATSMRNRLMSPSTWARRAWAADFALARVGQAGARRLDGLRQVAEPPRKQDLLPAAQLVAQALVTPRLGRLALQAAALLVDFEDDVVDAGEVLLRGLELQLRRPAPRLVLRDAGGFLDQHAPIGGPRRQDQPDLALLDDGVGLGAQPGVHQQFVDVPEPALGAVNEVLALTRPIEPAHQLDVAARGPELGQHGLGRREDLGGGLAVPVVAVAVGVPVAVPVAIAVAGTVVTPLSRRRTSAAPVGLRASLPPKMTSSIFSPRRLLALCSPSTHVIASATLLLPHPLGPTMAVTPAIEGELGAIGKGFEAGNLKAFEPHATPRYARTMLRSPVRPYRTGRAGDAHDERHALPVKRWDRSGKGVGKRS